MMPETPTFPAYKTVPVADLIPYARNSRTHSPAQIDKLAGRCRPWPMSQPSPTLVAQSRDELIDGAKRFASWTYADAIRLGSFPDDYMAKSDKTGKYMIGMSVPPKMTEAVARAVIDQWLQPKVTP